MPENAVMSQPALPISQIVMREDARNNNGGLPSGVCAHDSGFSIKVFAQLWPAELYGCAHLFQCVPSPLSRASCAQPCNLCLCSVLLLQYVITLPTAGQAWILQHSLFFVLNTRTQKRRAFSFWWPKRTGLLRLPLFPLLLPTHLCPSPPSSASLSDCHDRKTERRMKTDIPLCLFKYHTQTRERLTQAWSHMYCSYPKEGDGIQIEHLHRP